MSEMRMRHWKARTTFGEKAVDQVISAPHWREQYPELYRQLESPDKKRRFEAVLPEPIVLEIAKGGIYVYEGDPDGERLYCLGYKGKTKTKPARLLSALEAIQEYGSECIFMATDKSVGYKSEVDTFDETGGFDY
jgi:hypothetical protein